MHFEPAQYIIPDKIGEPGQSFWEGYKKAINEFKDLVLTILDDYGNGAFEVFIQGSADAPSFQPKPLEPGYNTDFFENIRLLTIDQANRRIIESTEFIGQEYDNDELPDLRAAFIKLALGRMDRVKKYPNKLHILKGSVKDNIINPDMRNCTIVIFIDWDKAENRLLLQNEHSD